MISNFTARSLLALLLFLNFVLNHFFELHHLGLEPVQLLVELGIFLRLEHLLVQVLLLLPSVLLQLDVLLLQLQLLFNHVI